MRESLKKVLRECLHYLDTGAPKPRLRAGKGFLKQDIQIPIGLLAVLTHLTLIAMMVLAIGPDWRNVLGCVISVSMLMTLVVIYIRRDIPALSRDDDGLTLLGLLSIISILAMGACVAFGIHPFAVPTSAIAILVSLLISPRLAIITSLIFSMFLGMLYRFDFNLFFYSLISNCVAVASVLKVRNRHDMLAAGWKIIGANLAALASLGLFQSWPFFEGWRTDGFLPAFVFGIGNGILATVLAVGLLPYLESIFSRMTPMRLLELADFNQTLLKRMMVEAPGTYHHSLLVATLGESAAEAIGANALLTRVGCYYHDIGKLVGPRYFIENQEGLTNRHDFLKAQMSRMVVLQHVKEGLALAKEYGLDQAISDFVPQHHGTSRISFFYQRALEEGEIIEESEYRYPGPKPQSKETAIAMLADSVEAAARSMEEMTAQRLRDMVHKIVNNKFIDGQFSNSPVTLADLHKIAESMIHTLLGIHHARIEYPEEKKAS